LRVFSVRVNGTEDSMAKFGSYDFVWIEFEHILWVRWGIVMSWKRKLTNKIKIEIIIFGFGKGKRIEGNKKKGN